MLFSSPQAIKNINELAFIYERNDEIFRKLDEAIEIVEKDLLLSQASEEKIEGLEHYLDIVKLDTESLEQRRAKVKSKIYRKLPYTRRTLENVLLSLCGSKEDFELTINAREKEMFLRISLKKKKILREVEELLEDMVPLDFALHYDLIYNPHSTLRDFTHAGLAQYTYQELREGVLKQHAGNKEL